MKLLLLSRYSMLVGSLLALLLCMPAASQQKAADTEWKVGLAQVKITPEKPVFLSGYGGRNKPYEKVEADLYAKALVLEDRAGNKAVIVTSDLLGFPAAIAEPICDRIRDKLGFKREQILLNSSHTHTGPALSLNPAARDKMTAADAERTVEYTKQLQDKIVEVVSRAASKLEPANLSAGSGVVHFVMNRREFTPTGVILGVNARGLADRTVPVLRIDGADGKLRAVLFGTACHGTTLGPQNYEVCGDFAGFAQALLQEQHPSAMPLYMLGCAGDANPYPRGGMVLSREHGAALSKEVARVLESKLRPIRGPLKVALDRPALPLQQPTRAELETWAKEKGGLRPGMAKQLLAILDKGEKIPISYPAPIAAWQFGDDLTVVGLSGEVVVDYVTLLEKALGPNKLWVLGYCNDVFGYLPSSRVLSEGGYETRGLYTGGIGLFDPKAQDVVVNSVKELAKKVGRELPK